MRPQELLRAAHHERRPGCPLLARLILALLAIYKRLLSPLLGERCRFEPSCADYARVATARFGAARGGILGLWRLARCQPLCRGGFDAVPDTFTLRRKPHVPHPDTHA
jgi:putative membrane protein insertion efficiency factor